LSRPKPSKTVNLASVQIIDIGFPTTLNIGLAHFQTLDNIARELPTRGTDYD
jgi:hypothetical protein